MTNLPGSSNFFDSSFMISALSLEFNKTTWTSSNLRLFESISLKNLAQIVIWVITSVRDKLIYNYFKISKNFENFFLVLSLSLESLEGKDMYLCRGT
jgi:hypothetical protein